MNQSRGQIQSSVTRRRRIQVPAAAIAAAAAATTRHALVAAHADARLHQLASQPCYISISATAAGKGRPVYRLGRLATAS